MTSVDESADAQAPTRLDGLHAIEESAVEAGAGLLADPSYARAAGNSFSVSGWTAVSRGTGLLRLVVVGAVLGPTFFGNVFQTVNTLPNIFVELLVGALMSSLIVPPLVRHLDRGDRTRAAALSNALLGLCVLAFSVLAVVMVALGPQLLRLFSSQIGSRAISAEQIHVGWPLLALIAPQVVLYGVAGVAVAAQNASGRFGLAAAAPAVENLGVIATLAAVAIIYGTSPNLADVPPGEILLLGIGSTLAVAAHAGLQWWGARRAGITLIPRLRWRDSEVREVVHLAVPSVGLASLTVLRWSAMFIVAGAVAGGVVAIQLAIALLALPIALGARPVATVTLPRLSRLAHSGAYQQFANEAASSVGLGVFLVAPLAVAYVVLAPAIAQALSFGGLSSAHGQHLLVLAVSACGISAVGDATMVIGSQISYALRDAVSPFIATCVRAVLGIGGMVIGAIFISGPGILVAVGLSISVADITAATILWLRLRRRMPRPTHGVVPASARALGCSAIMIGPAWLVAWSIDGAHSGHLVSITALLAGALTGALIYAAAQVALGSPELRLLREALETRRRPGGRSPRWPLRPHRAAADSAGTSEVPR